VAASVVARAEINRSYAVCFGPVPSVPSVWPFCPPCSHLLVLKEMRKIIEIFHR
jgi:hypothetical protein